MSNKKVCHLRCQECKAEAIGSSLEQCLDQIVCGQDLGPLNDSCRIALEADGKSVFKLEQITKDDYKGKTVVDKNVKIPEWKKPEKEKPKKETNNENQEQILPDVPSNETAPIEEQDESKPELEPSTSESQ